MSVPSSRSCYIVKQIALSFSIFIDFLFPYNFVNLLYLFYVLISLLRGSKRLTLPVQDRDLTYRPIIINK
ncbi:hypothetical protein EUGRSUZ_K01756 [Eucalyptus grandis]|uniref:Uncharacterized protein n=2 Tax=Eucalyptus grandis TaxID=71139 RepID=A0ACC3IUA4_EUCGR|nr:hypothetical protein EUGRSUZ_K01756 [Eucalyptus grandis]